MQYLCHLHTYIQYKCILYNSVLLFIFFKGIFNHSLTIKNCMHWQSHSLRITIHKLIFDFLNFFFLILIIRTILDLVSYTHFYFPASMSVIITQRIDLQTFSPIHIIKDFSNYLKVLLLKII